LHFSYVIFGAKTLAQNIDEIDTNRISLLAAIVARWILKEPFLPFDAYLLLRNAKHIGANRDILQKLEKSRQNSIKRSKF